MQNVKKLRSVSAHGDFNEGEKITTWCRPPRANHRVCDQLQNCLPWNSMVNTPNREDFRENWEHADTVDIAEAETAVVVIVGGGLTVTRCTREEQKYA